MSASAEIRCDFVDIDNVIASETYFVFSIDGVDEYGDFGSADFSQGVDDVTQFDWCYGIAVHVFGGEIAVNNFTVESQFAVHHHVTRDKRLDVRSCEIRLVHEACEVNSLV